MGCCESSSHEIPSTKRRSKKIDNIVGSQLNTTTGSDNIQEHRISFSLPLSDIDISLKVQKIWDDRNLSDDDGLDMGLAYPLIQDHIRRQLNLPKFTATNAQVQMIFAEINTNGNEVIDKKELFEFFKKQYGRQSGPLSNTIPTAEEKSDEEETFDYEEEQQEKAEILPMN